MKQIILCSTFFCILTAVHARNKTSQTADTTIEIKKELCINQSPRKQILQNEIEGVDTYYVELAANGSFNCRSRPDSVSVLLMTHGKALIQQGSARFTASGLNLFVPARAGATIVADKEGLGMLEIIIRLTPEEMITFENQQQVLPYFVDYTKCRQYREAIKSEKTISRMILPENIVPRFCMGSVQTTGVDEVGEHTHPMLEQLFYGLPGNDCIVTANGIRTAFGENILLHIPLGSKHGVKVEEGKILNYIWMDHFRSTDDMWYMKANHFMKDDK